MEYQKKDKKMAMVTMVGRLVRDVELSYTPNGAALAKYSIADRDSFDKEKTHFFECYSFGKTAELIAQYFAKGDHFLGFGELKHETWKDANTGQNRSKHTVMIDKVKFTGASRNQNNQGNGDSGANNQNYNKQGGNQGYKNQNNGNTNSQNYNKQGGNQGYRNQNNRGDGNNNGQNGSQGYRQNNNQNKYPDNRNGNNNQDEYHEDINEDVPF